VFVLSRSGSAHPSLGSRVVIIPWNPSDPNATLVLPDGTDAVVNLAGESIADGRWTDARKAAIRSSRVEATTAIVEGIRATSHRPSVLVNASAIGYYGGRGDETLTEDSSAGQGFLSDVVIDWEEAANKATELGVRVALMRIGVVLGRDGGALPQMALPFKLFGGGPVGSGRQWMSWIHLDDVVGMIIWAIENEQVSGAINTVAPEPLRNAEFSREIGRALHRPSWLPAPGFALRLILGELADTLLLEGQKVIPARAQELGYAFKYPRASQALSEALAA
jgi:uncharacterized protein (TIGR01777 family)